MKLIGYTRVSTEDQSTKGLSLDMQEAKLRAYCELYNHELVRVVSDPGFSAKTLDRPGLAEVLGGLEAGEAEGLVILKLDRLTRSVANLGHLLETYFTRHALLSVMEQTDTSTAGGRLVLNLLISVSQWEREVISERTSAALQHKKSLGVKLGPPALLDEATISRIRELRSQGLSLPVIAKALTAEGYTTKRGGAWHSFTVSKILNREPVPT